MKTIFLLFRSSNPRCPEDGTVLEKEEVSSSLLHIYIHTLLFQKW
jgi:hypothetical protein